MSVLSQQNCLNLSSPLENVTEKSMDKKMSTVNLMFLEVCNNSAVCDLPPKQACFTSTLLYLNDVLSYGSASILYPVH